MFSIHFAGLIPPKTTNKVGKKVVIKLAKKGVKKGAKKTVKKGGKGAVKGVNRAMAKKGGSTAKQRMKTKLRAGKAVDLAQQSLDIAKDMVPKDEERIEDEEQIDGEDEDEEGDEMQEKK